MIVRYFEKSMLVFMVCAAQVPTTRPPLASLDEPGIDNNDNKDKDKNGNGDVMTINMTIKINMTMAMTMTIKMQ